MTNGTKVISYRTLVNGYSQTCLGSSLNPGQIIGRHLSRTWSGSDSPSTSKKPFVLKTYRYRVWTWNVRKSAYVAKYRTRRVKEYVQGVRPPMTENSYTCSITDDTDGLFFLTDRSQKCANGNTVYSAVSTSTYGHLSRPIGYYWGSNDDLALLGKLSNRIQGDSFNAAVFLGEGKESLQTIAQAAIRIRRSLRDLRHGNVLGATEALLGDRKRHSYNKSAKQMSDEYVSSNWLQLQYGWMPLLNDVYGAAGHLAYMQNRPQVLKYRARKERNFSVELKSGGTTESGTAFVGKTIKALVSKVDEVGLLGLKDPASLAWELLPYSFVIDWFIPVGNYLDRLNLNRSLTARYVTSYYYRQTSTSVYFDQSFAFGLATFNHTQIRTGRSVSSSLNVPLPSIKPWEKIASWKHAANALALLSQLKR